jgi:phasin family protein
LCAAQKRLDFRIRNGDICCGCEQWPQIGKRRAMANDNTPNSESAKPAADTSAPAEPTAVQSQSKQAEAAPARKAPSRAKAKAPAKAASAKPAQTKAASKPKTCKPSAPRKFPGEKNMAAAKKDAATQTFETVTTASNEAMKEGFEKSLNAINEFSAFQKDSVDAVIASATTATKSMEELNASTVAFAKKSMEDGVAAAKSMAGAKSVQELIELHADYTKSTLDAYLTEVNKSSDLVSAMVKDTFKPINDRVAAAVEAMQSQR